MLASTLSPAKRLLRRLVDVRIVSGPSLGFVRVAADGEFESWPAGAAGAHFKVFLAHDDSDAVMRTCRARRFTPDSADLAVAFSQALRRTSTLAQPGVRSAHRVGSR